MDGGKEGGTEGRMDGSCSVRVCRGRMLNGRQRKAGRGGHSLGFVPSLERGALCTPTPVRRGKRTWILSLLLHLMRDFKVIFMIYHRISSLICQPLRFGRPFVKRRTL